MKKEIWKDIRGYEGLYQVSNKGRVKSLDRFINGKSGSLSKRNGKILKPPIGWGGNYLKVRLSKNSTYKNIYLHRLIAIHFIPNPKNKEQVNHIDLNKLNNNLENLEWVTRLENAQHSSNLGVYSLDYKKGENNTRSRINKHIVFKARELRNQGLTFNKISEKLNISIGCAQSAIYTWKHLKKI